MTNQLPRSLRTCVFGFAATCLFTGVAAAQGASTIVDVGPGFAGSDATASGRWTHTDTESRVGSNGSMARGLAIGAGPNGLSLSHSIGVNHGGVGLGHNLNLSIGRGGTHVSHGGVKSVGGNSRIIAGGGTQQNFGGISGRVRGGSTVTGFGNRTQNHSGARTRNFFRRW